MTPELRGKIDELIGLDNQYRSEQAAKYPNGITLGGGSSSSDSLLKSILSDGPSPVYQALAKLAKDELVYVMALMWFGRGDGIAERGATFESVLDYASKEFDDMTVTYVGEKPLGVYLPNGLKRLGLE